MNAPETIEEHNKQIAADYDRHPYVSKAFSYSAPGHLRAAAHLYGMDTVPLKHARVLELGCAAGGNLLPFALAYPEATVVGVDLSPVQVEQGQKVLQDLGVSNMQLHAMDLTAITPDFGQYDYIIVHGVFSWVPMQVKQAILRICRENLSPFGIAYVSYNTYPGWKAGDIVRDAMTLHCHGAETEEERLARAKAILFMLSEGLAPSHGMGASIRQMADSLRRQSDYYITHEYLERFNTPCYLVEFAEAAAQVGLAYVGDSEAYAEWPSTYGANVQLQLNLMALGQPKIMRQQYLDFAMGRNFRKSLLVHQERAERIAVTPQREAMEDLRWAGRFTQHENKGSSADLRSYRGLMNRTVHTQDKTVIAMVEALDSAWPNTLGYALLCEAASAANPEVSAESLRELTLAALEKLYCLGMLRHAVDLCPYDQESGDLKEMRLLPGFAYLHRRSADSEFGLGAINFWHDSVKVRTTDAQDWLLQHVDDFRDRTRATAMLARALQQGAVNGPEQKSYRGQRNLEPLAQKLVNELIDALQGCGLLLTK
ncbi:class I SAM-dependent methyltransferase [Achromobacter denitrificans]|uniref:Class I SAM-dependent methyltransferase n=1 Tax=Achromobacter denitrificans TaxID=32002 RepID=A0ABZ3G6S6_ACHDE